MISVYASYGEEGGDPTCAPHPSIGMGGGMVPMPPPLKKTKPHHNMGGGGRGGSPCFCYPKDWGKGSEGVPWK